MLILPIQTKHIISPLIVLTIALGLYFFEPASSQWLAYDRYEIQAMQLWRLLTGNLLHTNLNHLLLNAAGIILLWALHGEHYRPASYMSVFILCCLGCAVGLYFAATQMIWYVGLSGALHGMFIWGAYMDIRKGIGSGWILLAGVWGKILYEQLAGPSQEISELINADVATDAHLFGALTGMMIIIVLLAINYLTKQKS